jgi:hypothetical protein
MQGTGDPRMSSLRAHPGTPLGPYDQMIADHNKAREDRYKVLNEARYGPQGTQAVQYAPRGGWTIGPNGERAPLVRPAGGYGPQGSSAIHQGIKKAPRGGWTVGPNGELVHGSGRPAGGGGGGYGGGIKAEPYKYMGQWVYPSGPGGNRGGGGRAPLGGGRKWTDYRPGTTMWAPGVTAQQKLDVSNKRRDHWARTGNYDYWKPDSPTRPPPIVRYASRGGPAANPTMMNSTGDLRNSRAAQGMTGGGMARGSYHQGIGGYGGPESMQTSMWKPAPTFTPGPFHTTPRQQGLR